MNEHNYKLLLTTTLVLLASVLGIVALYSHTIMPGLKHTDNATFVRSFQAIDRQIINPIFMLQFFAPLFLLLGATVYAHKHHLPTTLWLYFATACYFAAVCITMVVNVPLNDGIKRLTDLQSAQSFAAARAQFNEAKWLLYNHIRTIATLVATVCTAMAVFFTK